MDKSSNKFKRTAYDPSMTEGKITSEEVNQVLTGLELVTYKLPTLCGNFIAIIHLFVIPLIAMIVFADKIYCGSVPRYYINDDYVSDYIVDKTDKSYAVFFVYWLLAFIYLNLKRKYQLIEIRAEVETIIQVYQSQFNKKGYRLFIPFNFPECIEIQRVIYPLPITNTHQFNILSMQSIRQYGDYLLQYFFSVIQKKRNSHDTNIPFNDPQCNNQC